MSGNLRLTLGLIGVRDYKGVVYENTTYVVRTIEHHIRLRGYSRDMVSLVTGGGKGVEALAIQWCIDQRVPCRKTPPNIQEFGHKKAFLIRNNSIVSNCDELIVFWDGCVDIIGDSIVTAVRQSKIATIYPVI